MREWSKLYLNHRMLVLLLMGFSSGLPLALTAGTLQAWMVNSGVDLTTIGIFSLVGLPYTLKFVWAPFMDRYVPPFLGRRRGWAVLTQISLALALTAMAWVRPEQSPGVLALLALLTAFFSASQDIVVDAYRAELLAPHEVAAGAAVGLGGYRIAMIFSGAIALVLSDHLPWRQVYLIMALSMGVGILASLMGTEPAGAGINRPPVSLRSAVVDPFKDFFRRTLAFEMLLFVILFKLDAVIAQAMKTPFLLDIGFSKTEIGAVSKAFGLVAALVGALLGGGLVVKLGLRRSLFWFTVLHGGSHFAFLILAWIGKNYAALVAAVGIDELIGGMGNTAFIAFLVQLCNKRFTATQYALLSSLAAVSRVVLASPMGFLAQQMGWTGYFLLSIVAVAPAALLLVYRFERWDTAQSAENN